MSVTEDYCSFELCKLLKEKGFDSPVQCTYDGFGVVSERWTKYSDNYTIRRWQTPCVTHQMAMKWLREVHKLYINVCPSVEGYYWTEKWHSYVENLEKRYPFGRFIGTFNSHEQACEVAIKYCLTNLI